jgi:methionyl-tRNA formyltransferase
LQKEIPISKEYSLDGLIRYSKRIGAHCIIEALDLISEGTDKETPNDSSKGSYFSFPTSKDVREFRKRGKRLL